MEFYVSVSSYNCYGGHTTLSKIGHFLLMDAIDFGDAVRELNITLHLKTSGPAKKTLESLRETHAAHRATLPKITYYRAKGRIELSIASEAMDGDEWERSPRLSLPLFLRGLDEVIRSLILLRKRLKKSDDFDLEAFLVHCEAARQRVPDTEDQLQALGEKLEAADQAKRDAMSPWEKLGIDWEDFHPQARAILDDPFYWDCVNDFAPHGNDMGADLLEDYRAWLKKNGHGQILRFIAVLAKRWGYQNWASVDDEVRDEASVALAFADLKLRSTCAPEARQLALEAIGRQRKQSEESEGWSHRDERLQTLGILEAKLRQAE